jgi:hypothetical protein
MALPTTGSARGRPRPSSTTPVPSRPRSGDTQPRRDLRYPKLGLRAKCCGCTEAFQASRAGSIPVARSGRHGEWRSLVAHPAGGRAVAGSNPVSPTQGKVCICRPCCGVGRRADRRRGPFGVQFSPGGASGPRQPPCRESACAGADLDELIPSGRVTTFQNRVGWATTYLYRTKLIDRPKPAVYRITDRGRQVLAENPSASTSRCSVTRAEADR